MTHASRRQFLHRSAGLAIGAALAPRLEAFPSPIQRIVDAHIHLYDPTRAGGVPWPTPDDPVLYRPALPMRYSDLARPEGVLAAIAIECSPLASDNDWLLHTAAGNEIIVGIIGDLDPSSPSFVAELDRLAEDPLFLGIRYGNLWNRDLGRHIEDPAFLMNLRHLARRELVLESANPTPRLVAHLLQLATRIPDLCIVIDHLPQAVPPDALPERKQYLNTLKQLSVHPKVFVKVSEIPRRIDGIVPLTLAPYLPWLDTLWALFGEDRLLFGSDWPNSDHLTPLDDVFLLARSYLLTHGASAAKKFFWSNSETIYRWKPRNESQRFRSEQHP